MDIHLGKLILEKLKEKGMTKSEFARRINKSRQNVQDVFKRQSLDTDLLADVSKVLNFNFFQLLANEQNSHSSVALEDPANYKSSKTEKQKQKNQLDQLSKQLKLAQKEIKYLQRINTLLEKKADRKK